MININKCSTYKNKNYQLSLYYDYVYTAPLIRFNNIRSYKTITAIPLKNGVTAIGQP